MADTFLGAELIARNLIPSRFGFGQQNTALILDGDSKHYEPGDAFRWACARRGLVEPTLVGIGVGGSQSGNSSSAPQGLTSAARMATGSAAIAAQASAGKVVDYSLKVGTNDIGASVAVSTILANLRKFHEQVIRASGLVRYTIFTAVDPRSDQASYNPAIIALNQLLETYCKANPFDTLFVNQHSYLVDPTSATGIILGGGNGSANSTSFGAITYDGLHEAANGPLVASPAYEDAAIVLYGRRPALTLSKADIYVVSGVSHGNMIGFDTGYNPTGTGRFAAIGGTDGLTNSGSGSKSGTPPLGFTDGGTLTGTAGVVRSAQTITLFGQSVPVVRYAFSGTPTSNLQISIDQLNYSQGSAAYDMQAELAFVGNALGGFAFLGLSCSNGMPSTNIGDGGLGYNASGLAKVDGFYRLASAPAQATVPYQFNSTIQLYAKAGTPLSGSIDLIKASVHRTGPIPASA